MKFSTYDNAYKTKPSRQIELDEAYKIVSTGTYLLNNDIKQQIEKLRNETDENLRKNLKKMLPVFAFSGEFTADRQEAAPHTYSQLLCIDIDGLEANKLTEIFNKLKNWGNTHLLFISPSGNGLKLVVQVDSTEEKHKQVYHALMLYLSDTLTLPLKDKTNPNGLDTSCQDTARCCFMAYDANAFYNENAISLDTKSLLNQYKDELKAVTTTKAIKGLTGVTGSAGHQNVNSNSLEVIEHICLEAETRNISLSNSHAENISIAWALLSVGADVEYFHRITKLNPDYNYDRMQERYIRLAKRANKYSLGTLIYLAVNAGIVLPDTILDNHLTDLQFIHNWLINQYEFRTNEISGKIEYRNSVKNDDYNSNKWSPLEDQIVNGWYIDIKNIRFDYITDEKRKSKKLNITKSDLWDSINNYNFSKKVNPVIEYFKDLHSIYTIDGNKPLEEVNKWIKGFNYDNSQYAEDFWLDWLYGVIRNLTTEDYYDKILVLSGPGGSGKTYGITKRLCSPFTDYLTNNFNWSLNKDELSKITKYLFILDDELNTSRKADVDMIKSITSLPYADIREAYARTAVRRPRLANFIATTNNREFLTDITGNRRFLVLEVLEGNRELINSIDYKKLWAEVWNYYFVLKNKSELSDEVINQNNEAFRSISAEEEALEQCFDFTNISDGKSQNSDFIVTTTKEILEHIKDRTGSEFKEESRTTGKIKAILYSKGLNNKNTRHNGKQGKWWFLKRKLSNTITPINNYDINFDETNLGLF